MAALVFARDKSRRAWPLGSSGAPRLVYSLAATDSGCPGRWRSPRHERACPRAPLSDYGVATGDNGSLAQGRPTLRLRCAERARHIAVDLASRIAMFPESAPQSRTAVSINVSSTGCTSEVERRRRPPLPIGTTRAGCAATEDEYEGLGVALLLDHRARPRRPRPSTGLHALSAEAAAGACSGAGHPADEAVPGSGLKYKTAFSIAFGAATR
jgi:hypothetical protein